MDLDGLNRLDAAEAHQAFRECCASEAWAMAMTLERPFASIDRLLDAAGSAWRSLDPADQDEAFSAHPRIGESATGDDRHSTWSRREQAAAGDIAVEIRHRLAECNREYETRFGRVYLVFATGKSAEEMLALCETRLANDPEVEHEVAAQEQEKITALRLRRLVGID